jgi:hypothetical protein
MNPSSRRNYLAGLVGLTGLTALSGCQDTSSQTSDTSTTEQNDDSETDEASGPVRAVETFYAALDAGRFDAANELLHSQTTESRVTEQRYGNVAEGNLSVESTSEIERTENWAVVRTSIRASFADTDRETTQELDVELRAENGEWRLYSVGPPGETDGPPTEEPTPEPEPEPNPDVSGDPEALVREFYTALDGGNRAEANALIHSDATDLKVTERAAERMIERSLTVEETRVIDAGDDATTVAVTVIVSSADADGERSTRPRIELRPEDGEWKLYSLS